jgi:hypothetical protein
MATAAVNSPEPDTIKIISTTLKHMDLNTTLNHYVDFTFPKDSFSMVHREESRKDLPGPSGRLQHRITHGAGGLIGAVLQVAGLDPVLERESLSTHVASMAGVPTRRPSETLRRRRGHIVTHTADALYSEDASALAVLDPCASAPQLAREDDGWAQQLQGTPVGEYVEALVLGAYGFDTGRRRLGLPVSSLTEGPCVASVHKVVHRHESTVR